MWLIITRGQYVMSNAVGMPYQKRSYYDDLLDGLYYVKRTVISSQEAFPEG